jgi:hypothetical protein
LVEKKDDFPIEYEMFKVMKEKLEINSKKKNSLRKKYNNNCERGD